MADEVHAGAEKQDNETAENKEVHDAGVNLSLTQGLFRAEKPAVQNKVGEKQFYVVDDSRAPAVGAVGRAANFPAQDVPVDCPKKKNGGNGC
jgi:hypothetical protein